jgi:sarcosine oxidase subunit beta
MAYLRKCGALVVQSPESELFLSRVLNSYDQIGLEYEWWDASKIEERLKFDMTSYGPPKRIDDDTFGDPNEVPLTSGVYFPLAGYVSDPMLATCNLQAAAQATGKADFAFNKTVTSILRSGGRASGVRFTDGSEVHAPVVINVGGPHSSHITDIAFPDPSENDMKWTTRAMRQEVSYIDSPPEVNWGDGGSGMIVTDLGNGVYFRPEVGGKILAGSVEPSCDEPYHDFPKDPEEVYPGNEGSGLTEQWTNQVYRTALRMPTLPLPDSTNVQGCVACYDVTEDWTPIYDKSALPGYYMAIGTSGNQFKNAGVAGRLMREIIEANEGGRDTDADPLQFELKRIPGGGMLNAATFSRLRPQLATSGSVLG